MVQQSGILWPGSVNHEARQILRTPWRIGPPLNKNPSMPSVHVRPRRPLQHPSLGAAHLISLHVLHAASATNANAGSPATVPCAGSEFEVVQLTTKTLDSLGLAELPTPLAIDRSAGRRQVLFPEAHLGAPGQRPQPVTGSSLVCACKMTF